MNHVQFAGARRLALALALGLSAPAAFAFGEPDGATMVASSKVALSDVRWMEKAARASITEVEAGKLAMTQSTRNEVREFGKDMVRQHGKAKDELRTIAERKGVLLPVTPDGAQMRMLEKLAPMSGAEFDREFMAAAGSREQIDTAKLFEDGISSLKDPDIRLFARRTLPLIKHQFELVREIRPETTATKPAS